MGNHSPFVLFVRQAPRGRLAGSVRGHMWPVGHRQGGGRHVADQGHGTGGEEGGPGWTCARHSFEGAYATINPDLVEGDFVGFVEACEGWGTELRNANSGPIPRTGRGSYGGCAMRRNARSTRRLVSNAPPGASLGVGWRQEARKRPKAGWCLTSRHAGLGEAVMPRWRGVVSGRGVLVGVLQGVGFCGCRPWTVTRSVGASG